MADCFDEDFFNSSNVKCGTLITTEDIYIDSLEEKLDLDTAEKAGSDKVFNIENSGWDHNIVGNYAAGVIGIKQFNWKRALLARGYMIVNYSDGSNKVLYTGVSPSRSIVQVAEFLRDSGYPDMTPEQIAVVQKYLSED